MPDYLREVAKAKAELAVIEQLTGHPSRPVNRTPSARL
jgi:hypothetical protein